jgi:hypothetical protein
VFASPGLPSCRLAFDFLGFLVPSTASSELAPCEMEGPSSISVPLSGFGWPLSGFLAGSDFVALFHATTVPGILPSELSPHKDRESLSRSLAPLQLSTGVLGCVVLRLVAPGFTDVRLRSCLDSPWTMDFLFTNRGPLPGCPGLRSTESPRSASFTYFGAFLPLRVRCSRSWVAPPPLLAALLGFFPFGAFSFHASGSLPVPASWA